MCLMGMPRSSVVDRFQHHDNSLQDALVADEEQEASKECKKCIKGVSKGFMWHVIGKIKKYCMTTDKPSVKKMVGAAPPCPLDMGPMPSPLLIVWTVNLAVRGCREAPQGGLWVPALHAPTHGVCRWLLHGQGQVLPQGWVQHVPRRDHG